MLEWGDLLLTQGGPHRHRAVAQILQHGTTAQRVGISPSRARELDRGRMKPSGSLQCWCGARASNAGPCPTPPSRSNPSLYSLTNWYKIPVRPNAFRDKYERYLSSTPFDADRKRKALTAVAAKMARVAYAVVKHGSDYQCFFEHRLPSGSIPLARAVEA